MIDINRVAQKDPPPTYIWPDAIGHLGSKCNALTLFGCQSIHFVSVSVLNQGRKIISLRFDIGSVGIVEFFKKPCEDITYAVEEIPFPWFYG